MTEEPKITFARSATKHRISRERSLHIIERCGLQIVEHHRNLMPPDVDQRVVFLGDDLEGVAVEVVAIEEDDDEFLVIHSMNMRKGFGSFYEEARQWAT